MKKKEIKKIAQEQFLENGKPYICHESIVSKRGFCTTSLFMSLDYRENLEKSSFYNPSFPTSSPFS
jgi:hypothetical protein